MQWQPSWVCPPPSPRCGGAAMPSGLPDPAEDFPRGSGGASRRGPLFSFSLRSSFSNLPSKPAAGRQRRAGGARRSRRACGAQAGQQGSAASRQHWCSEHHVLVTCSPPGGGLSTPAASRARGGGGEGGGSEGGWGGVPAGMRDEAGLRTDDLSKGRAQLALRGRDGGGADTAPEAGA